MTAKGTPGDRGWTEIKRDDPDERLKDEWVRSDRLVLWRRNWPDAAWQIDIPYADDPQFGKGREMSVSINPDGCFGETLEKAMDNADRLWPLGFFNTGKRCTCPSRVGSADSDVNTLWCQECKRRY